MIAEIAEEGIVLSADKRVTLDGAWKDNCIKAFAVGDKTAVGIVGKQVAHPRTIKRLLNKNFDKLNGRTVYDRAVAIARVIADHDDESNIPSQMKLTVVGYDEVTPHIYEIEIMRSEVSAPKDRSPYIVSHDKIAYEITSRGLVAVHQKDYKKESYATTLKRHRKLIVETSSLNDSVSPTSDNYLITPNSIDRI